MQRTNQPSNFTQQRSQQHKAQKSPKKCRYTS